MMQASAVEKAPARIWITTLILLLAAALLILHAGDLSIWEDEAYTVHHISGSFEQLFRDRELMWPPTYYLLLYPWMRLVGPYDVLLRLVGAGAGLLGTAFMFRAGRRLGSLWIGWLAALLFATSSYVLYFLLELRGYNLMLMFIALAIWMHLRWLAWPSWRRAVPYGLALIGLWYSQYAGLLVTALFGIHVLLSAPRRLPRWLAIALIVAAAYLPWWPTFIDASQVRANVLTAELPSYFLQGPGMMVEAYSAGHPILFVILVIMTAGGIALLLRQDRRRWVAVLWLLGWGVGVPAAAYVLRESAGLYTSRYLTFTIPGTILLLALGLGSLPDRARSISFALALALALFAWNPFAFRPSYSDSPPVRDLVREMAARLKPGEALVMDPGCNCGIPLIWWYYESLYMPGGRPIPRAEDPSDVAGGVWYLSRQGAQDAALRQAAGEGRLYTGFWGPWYFIAEHYEAPPLRSSYRVGEGIRFRGAAVTPERPYRPGDTLTVESWWAVDQPPNRDYSIGLQMLDGEGRLIAQTDGGPAGPFTPPQTSAWQPGTLYRDDRALQIPYQTPMGAYKLRLVVYFWEDGLPLPVVSPEGVEQDSLPLGAIWVDSWGGYNLLN